MAGHCEPMVAEAEDSCQFCLKIRRRVAVSLKPLCIFINFMIVGSFLYLNCWKWAGGSFVFLVLELYISFPPRAHGSFDRFIIGLPMACFSWLGATSCFDLCIWDAGLSDGWWMSYTLTASAWLSVLSLAYAAMEIDYRGSSTVQEDDAYLYFWHLLYRMSEIATSLLPIPIAYLYLSPWIYLYRSRTWPLNLVSEFISPIAFALPMFFNWIGCCFCLYYAPNYEDEQVAVPDSKHAIAMVGFTSMAVNPSSFTDCTWYEKSSNRVRKYLLMWRCFVFGCYASLVYFFWGQQFPLLKVPQVFEVTEVCAGISQEHFGPWSFKQHYLTLLQLLVAFVVYVFTRAYRYWIHPSFIHGLKSQYVCRRERGLTEPLLATSQNAPQMGLCQFVVSLDSKGWSAGFLYMKPLEVETIVFEKKIGEGGYGIIVRVRIREGRKLRALKLFPNKSQREFQVYEKIWGHPHSKTGKRGHPRIVQLHSVSEWQPGREFNYTNGQKVEFENKPNKGKKVFRLGLLMEFCKCAPEHGLDRATRPGCCIWCPQKTPDVAYHCLEQFIKEEPRFNWRRNHDDASGAGGLRHLKLSRQFSAEILSALDYLHTEVNVLHRDLKPENVFMVGTPDKPHIKLGDFGVSKNVTSTDIPTTVTVAGSHFFAAPELVCLNMARIKVYERERDIDISSVDIFSFGMLNFTLAWGLEENQVGDFLSAHERDYDPDERDFGISFTRDGDTVSVDNAAFLQDHIDLREFLDRPARRNTNNMQQDQDGCRRIGSWVDLIESCASVVPNRRLCTTELLNHPFFKEITLPCGHLLPAIDWDRLMNYA